MGLATQRKAITRYFYDNWDESDGVVAYPNKLFTTPSGQPWLAFNILDLFKKRASLGSGTWFVRRVGIVQVDIYVPENTGSAAARAKADIIEDMFESVSITTDDSQVVRFRTPTTSAVALNEQRAANLNDSWYRLIVTAEYYVDEVKSS